MASRRRGADLPEIRALFHGGTTGQLTDDLLLARFVSGDRDVAEMAFAALVERHGPMVLRVCRTILRDSHEAEDAFQATFLVLVRRASSISKRGSAASWLHGVARRVASCARLTYARRRSHERRSAEMARRSVDPETWDDLGDVLHEEIGRLSASYRAAIVVCDLEGLTEGQAAQRLGWPVGTVRSRLTRARERLRDRLIRRGLVPSVAVWSALPAAEAASVVVSPALMNAIVQGAVQLGLGGSLAAGTVPAMVSTLTEEVLKTMLFTKLKMTAGVVLTVGTAALLTIGTVGFTQEKPKAKPATAPVVPPANAIQAKLEERVSMSFPNDTPLEDVLKYIKAATTGAKEPGIPIYVDPLGLREAHKDMTSTIRFDVNDSPLQVTLAQVLAQLGLAYTAEDDVLIISSPKGIEREQNEKRVLAPGTFPDAKGVLAKLDEPITMSFPTETPLDDVLNYIKAATKGANDAGIPIVVNARGLRDARKSLNSTVLSDLDGVPLRTTLRLLLKQLGLAYVVKDGLLLISSPSALRELEGSLDNVSKAKGDEKK